MLLALVAVQRSASFAYGVMDIDEAHWTLIGRLVLDGGVPYVDFVDHKPPGLFYLFAAFVALGGGSLISIHGFVCAWVAATGLLAGRAVRELGGTPGAAALTSLAYVLLASSNVITANSELLSDLPVAAAVVLAARSLRTGVRAASLAGALTAVAVLIRPQAGVLVPALLGAFWMWGARGRRALAFLGGLAVPLAATALAFLAAGRFGELWEWNVVRNLGYPPPPEWAGLLGLRLLQFVIGSAAWAWWLAVLAARDGLRRPRDPAVVLGTLLLAGSVLAVWSGRRFYPHYFVQLALPLALLAGPRAAALLADAARRGGRWVAPALAAAIAVPAVSWTAINWVRGALGYYPEQDATIREVARYLNSEAAPRGRVLVWGDSSQLYVATRRLPGTRYYNVAPVVGNFDTAHVPEGFDVAAHVSEGDVARLLEDAERLRPALVVDTSTAGVHGWDKLPLARVEPLRRYVAEKYEPLARVAGVAIYARRGGGR